MGELKRLFRNSCPSFIDIGGVMDMPGLQLVHPTVSRSMEREGLWSYRDVAMPCAYHRKAMELGNYHCPDPLIDRPRAQVRYLDLTHQLRPSPTVYY